jgi:hypothetical protein
MAKRSSFYAATTLLACVVFWPAQARAGAVLITRGETIKHLGDAVAPKGQQLGALKIGYKYGYWGVFWIDLWTWGGQYCVYEDKRYQPIEVAEAAGLLGKPADALSPPFLYRVPLGWLIFGPLIVLGIIGNVMSKKSSADATAPPLLQDPRYQKALEIMNEQYAKNKVAVPAGPAQEGGGPENDPNQEIFRAAFEAGVQHLQTVGITREEAERNLALMVHMQSNAPPQANPPAQAVELPQESGPK